MQVKKYLILLIVLFSFSQLLSAKSIYRYKDRNGNAVISDRITNEMIELGYDVMNESGMVVQRVAPGKTLAEEKEDKKLALEKKKKELELKEQIHRDAQLLRQFGSISDIIRSRDSDIIGLEQRVKIQKTNIDLFKLELENLQKQAATHERLGQSLPKKLQNDIVYTKQQITDSEKNISYMELEKGEVAKSYEKDILRFKHLESLRKNLRNKKQASQQSQTTIYDCPDSQKCHMAWQLAQIYAKNNASGKIEIITNTLIITSSPEKDTDIALSFSRIPSADDNEQIILDVSCNDTEKGAALCTSQQVEDIRKNYLIFLQERLGTDGL